MLQIDGTKNGWFHLTEVWHPDDDTRKWPLGWVHGSRVGTWVKDPGDYGPNMVAYLYDAPDGVQAWTFPGDQQHSIRYLGCEGEWVQVKVSGNGRTGWLHPEQHCPNAVTNCS